MKQAMKFSSTVATRKVAVAVSAIAAACLSLSSAEASPGVVASSAAVSRPGPSSRMPSTKIAAVKPLRKGEVWHLKQSSILLGDYEVLVNSVGLRASCARSGLTFVASAPEWKAVGFNERKRLIWKPLRRDFTPASSMYKALNVVGMPSVANLPLVGAEKTRVLGFDCETYKTSAQFSAEQKAQLKQGLITTRFPREAEYRAARALLPVPVCHLLEDIFGMPDYGALPLFYSFISFGHGVKSVLLTSACTVEAEPRDWLKVPQQFKTVKAFIDLNLDKESESGLENLF